ncbi:hypothetical protein MKX03_019565, partial [Papaver bracteatum]
MNQQTQSDSNLLNQQTCAQYILGGSKARKYKAYNEKRKADRASKKEQVQKVKSTKQVSSCSPKKRREKELAENEKQAVDTRRMADADTVRKLNLVSKTRVRVQPETL